jgi:cytochrome c oxidase accessory protein FixG
MLDEESLLDTYKSSRGEPRTRGQTKSAALGVDAGDCIDCNACVVVCPMGIDIRDGNQLECITCALCIDACNDVMGKVERSRGLISYTTLRDYNAHMAEAQSAGRAAATAHQRTVSASHVVRPRTMIYAGLWSLIGIAMLIGLVLRDRLDINVIPDRNPLFVVLSDGSIRNGYTLKILNMQPEPATFHVSVDNLPGAKLWLADEAPDGSQSVKVEVEPDRLREIKVFVSLPADQFRPGSTPFGFAASKESDHETATEMTEFLAPEQ